MNITGDMAIKDLTPQTTNIGDRIVKNMRICGSGIYTYDISEAHLLHLTPIPEKYKDLQYINVYRPAEVLNANKDKFARVPIITGHHVLVNRNNAKQLVVGMVGDNVESEIDEKDGETYLYTTGTIVAGDGVDAYERLGQLSVGYDPVIEWAEGNHNGTPYQAVLKGFNDVNHLLICKVARGGPQCMVMDSLDNKTPLQRFVNNNHGGVYMGIFGKIFGSDKPKLAGDAATASVLLQSIALGANAEATVKKIRAIAGDSIDAEMDGFLKELSAITGDEKKEDIERAVSIVDEKWHKLNGDACTTGDTEKTIEVKKDGDDKNVEVKKDGKETKDIEVKKDGDKKEVKVEEKSAGDAIDYEKLADMVAARLRPVVSEESEESAGDAINEKQSAEALKQLSVALAGDTSKEESISSDSLLKGIWG